MTSKTLKQFFTAACLMLALTLTPSMATAQTAPECQAAAANRNWSPACLTNPTPQFAFCVEVVNSSGGVIRTQTMSKNAGISVNNFLAALTQATGLTHRPCGFVPPSCTPLPNQTRTTTPCPVGQTGVITEQRTADSCNNFGPWQVIGNTCTVPPLNTCLLPWGGTIASGASVTAFQASSVGSGQTCVSETRTCTNGVLSGTFTFQNCTVNPPNTCALPWGGTIANGQSVTAYRLSTQPFGSLCATETVNRETRTCNNGVLSGTFTFQTCQDTPGATCTTPWGQQVLHGQSVTAFLSQNGTNGTCTSETRLCTNGSLSGSYTFQSCNVPPANACILPWGGSIANGTSIQAFQTANVPFGQTCTSETRNCANGVLSGSFVNQACSVNPPASCTLPWGGTLANGQSVTAFETSSVGNGQTCNSQQRTCTNGVLSGTFTFQNCNVTPPVNCTAPWGASVANGQSVTAYRLTSQPVGSDCETVPTNRETRTCTNGTLSGSFTNQSCSNTPPASCTLPWGGTLANGQSVTAYRLSAQPFGNDCEVVPTNRETRTCTNGTLSGSFTNQSCTVNPPASCALPWGGTIANGQSVTAFETSTVANGLQCVSQQRTCTNGVLSGSYGNQSCNVQPPAACNIVMQAGNYLNLNVKQKAEEQGCAIVPGMTVTLTILPGATIGSNNVGFPAFTTGTGWPSNVTIRVTNRGRIQGAGGDGAYVLRTSGVLVPAEAGGIAVDAPYPMIFDNSQGEIWGGGGGGGTIGFGRCSPAGGGGAGVVPGETFDPWGNCNASGGDVSVNDTTRFTRMGKNTSILANNVEAADNEYMFRMQGTDRDAIVHVSGPGGVPGQAGGNAHVYVRERHGQLFGTPSSTILGYFFYPNVTLPGVVGGDAGFALNPMQLTNISFTNNGLGDRRGRDYPTSPARAATPQPPLSPEVDVCVDQQPETREVACAAGQTGQRQQQRTVQSCSVTGTQFGQWTDVSNTCASAPTTCNLPWGGTINVGQSVWAYAYPIMTPGFSCGAPYAQQRTCQANGQLSGHDSYGTETCRESLTNCRSVVVATSSSSAGRGSASAGSAASVVTVCESPTWRNGQIIGTTTTQNGVVTAQSGANAGG